ncbi:MAG: OmpA family protein [Archangiaceae bacterium]|nr:OmpA family protein [Archangiaceae bacterium]
MRRTTGIRGGLVAPNSRLSLKEPFIVKAPTRLSRLVVLSMLAATAAFAQEKGNFPGDRFRMSLSRSGLIDVEWGSPAPHLNWDAGLFLNYSANNLVLYRISDNQRIGPLIGSRLGGSLFGTIGLFGWLEAGLELPVVLTQSRDTSLMGGTVTNLSALQGGLGDLRLQPKLRFFSQEDVGFDLAVMPTLTFPTGGQTNYRGEPTVTFQPELLASRAWGQLRTAINVGGVVRGRVSFIDDIVGSDVTARLGVGYRFQDDKGNGLPLEIDGSLFMWSGVTADVYTPSQRGMELRAMAAYTFADRVQVFLGGGVGLLSGWSTPDGRVFAGVRYGQWDDRKGPKDTDKDGIFDEQDKCLEVVGIFENQGCPDRDTDNDGFVDRLDKCVNEKGIKELNGCPDRDTDEDGFVDRKDKCPKVKGVKELEGCPDADGDGDGLVDRLDKCPTEKEDPDAFKDDDGCPDPDNDEDGVTDTSDKCPMEKGVVENRGCPDKDDDQDTVVDRLDNCPGEKGDPKFQGCKSKQFVVITKEKLEILAPVFFKVGSDIIDPRSFAMLDNVAQVLNGHPEVEKVRVEGHTDNQGDPKKNLDLSQRRANSVKKYLVEKGKVADGRLTATGYGDQKPIEDNKTPAGREKNRRVVFSIAGNE